MTKATVDVTGGDLAQHADDTWQALMDANDPAHPEVMLRGETLVRVVRDESRVKLEPYTTHSLRDRMSRVADFVRQTQQGARSVKPPVDVTSVLLHRSPHDLQAAPRVNRVTEVPVFGTDDSLLTTPGYHRGARTYYQPFNGAIASLPNWSDESPSGQQARAYDVEAAVRFLLEELLGDFPFRDQASRANALALLLEPFARELVGDHPTPLYLIMAPAHGTGKSKLAETCLAPGCGRVSVTAPPSADEDEFRKRLTSMLMTAPAAIWLDNVGRKLDSESLAAVLTATRWTERILGHSRMADVAVRNVWVATLNNPTISTELTRRSVPIFLDANVSEPWTRNGPEEGRTWKHQLPQWAFEQRASLVESALVLIANYVHGDVDYSWPDEKTGEFGRSRAIGSRFMGTYERWSYLMGGILAAAGVKGFLENREDLHADADADRSEVEAFFAEWHERTQVPLTVDELASLVSGLPAGDAPAGPPIPMPLDLRMGKDPAQTLGYFLRKHKGALIGGHRLTKHPGRHNKWSLERVV